MKLFESNRKRLTESKIADDTINETKKDWVGGMTSKKKIIEQKLQEVDGILKTIKTFTDNMDSAAASNNMKATGVYIHGTSGLDEVTLQCFYETVDKSDTTPDMIKTLSKEVAANMPRGFKLEGGLNGKHNKNAFVVNIVYGWGNSYF
jgi:hypothetical protein